MFPSDRLQSLRPQSSGVGDFIPFFSRSPKPCYSADFCGWHVNSSMFTHSICKCVCLSGCLLVCPSANFCCSGQHQVFTRCLRSYRWNFKFTESTWNLCVNVQVKNIFSFQFERYVIFCLHVGFLEKMFSPKFRSFFQICTFQIHINFWISLSYSHF